MSRSRRASTRDTCSSARTTERKSGSMVRIRAKRRCVAAISNDCQCLGGPRANPLLAGSVGMIQVSGGGSQLSKAPCNGRPAGRPKPSGSPKKVDRQGVGFQAQMLGGQLQLRRASMGARQNGPQAVAHQMRPESAPRGARSRRRLGAAGAAFPGVAGSCGLEVIRPRPLGPQSPVPPWDPAPRWHANPGPNPRPLEVERL